jgi:hypothetical protein
VFILLPWLEYSSEWSKSHATRIKIFIDSCNSVQFDWINKHTISLWLYNSPRRSHHVVTCSRQSVSCLFNSRSARMYFSHVQRVFIVEHHLASRPFLTYQNEFRDTFPDSPVPRRSTISRLVNRFRDTGSVQDRNRSGWPSVDHRWSRWTFPTLIITLFFVLLF